MNKKKFCKFIQLNKSNFLKHYFIKISFKFKYDAYKFPKQNEKIFIWKKYRNLTNLHQLLAICHIKRDSTSRVYRSHTHPLTNIPNTMFVTR